MCDTCGCSQPSDAVTFRKVGEEHEHTHTHTDGTVHTHSHDHSQAHTHSHSHDHTHEHSHNHSESRTLAVETDVLSKNNLLAAPEQSLQPDFSPL